jgi:hypothetical protein
MASFQSHLCSSYDFMPKFRSLVATLANTVLDSRYGMSGFSTAGSKFISIVRRARMVSAGDNGIYTGLGLRGVIPYVQCGAAVFLR